jgi:hypothetical protein
LGRGPRPCAATPRGRRALAGAARAAGAARGGRCGGGWRQRGAKSNGATRGRAKHCVGGPAPPPAPRRAPLTEAARARAGGRRRARAGGAACVCCAKIWLPGGAVGVYHLSWGGGLAGRAQAGGGRLMRGRRGSRRISGRPLWGMDASGGETEAGARRIRAPAAAARRAAKAGAGGGAAQPGPAAGGTWGALSGARSPALPRRLGRRRRRPGLEPRTSDGLVRRVRASGGRASAGARAPRAVGHGAESGAGRPGGPLGEGGVPWPGDTRARGVSTGLTHSCGAGDDRCGRYRLHRRRQRRRRCAARGARRPQWREEQAAVRPRAGARCAEAASAV